MATLIALVPLIEPIGFLRVEKGERFEVNESELDSYVPVGLAQLAVDAPAEADSEEGKVFESDEAPVWTKKISPTEYLEKYPSGPAADLARKVLAAEAAGASTSTES
jgi:hypothetical protein